MFRSFNCSQAVQMFDSDKIYSELDSNSITDWYIHKIDQSLQSVEICCRVFMGTFGPGSEDPEFESWLYPITLSPHIHQCSSTGLSKAEWCVDCLWFMHLKEPLGSFEKSRGISPVPGFQFWLKSDSLSLSGTSDAHSAQWANAAEEEDCNPFEGYAVVQFKHY
jgi:hypothetical protein